MDYRIYIKSPGYIIGVSSVIVTGLLPNVVDVIISGIKFKFESDNTEYIISSNTNYCYSISSTVYNNVI